MLCWLTFATDPLCGFCFRLRISLDTLLGHGAGDDGNTAGRKHLSQMATLITMSHVSARNRALSRQKRCDLIRQLTRTLNRGTDWCWFGFEVVTAHP